MTALEQKPKAQVTPSVTQSGNDQPSRQSQQQQQTEKDRSKPERNQSAQQDDSSFTVSADDFMML